MTVLHSISETATVWQSPAGSPPDPRLSSLLDVTWSLTDSHRYHLARVGDPARRRWHLERLQQLATIRGRVERRAFAGKAVAA